MPLRIDGFSGTRTVAAVAEGETFTLRGQGFAAGGTAPVVLYADFPLTPQVWTDTEITLVAPAADLPPSPVVVEVAGQRAVGPVLAVTIPTAAPPPTPPPPPPPPGKPTLTSVTPTSIRTGEPFTVRGSGFGNTRGEVAVGLFVGAVTGGAWSDTEITCPGTQFLGPGTYPVQVRRADRVLSNTLPLTVLGATPPPPTPPPPTPPPGTGKPILAAVSPTAGKAGDLVTFTGSDFGDAGGWIIWSVPTSRETPQGMLRVEAESWSDTRATGRVPAQALTGPVFLRRMDNREQSMPLPFTVTAGGTPPPPTNPPPTTPPPPTQPPPGSENDVLLSRRVIELTNIERLAAGLPALQAMDLPEMEAGGEIGEPWSEGGAEPSEEMTTAALGPLAENALLMVAAQAHSQDQFDHGMMSHTGSDGSNPGQRITRAGYRATTWGENVARGFTSPESVVAAWMNSPGHRANILNGAFVHIGVGHVGGTWTQVFAAGG